MTLAGRGRLQWTHRIVRVDSLRRSIGLISLALLVGLFAAGGARAEQPEEWFKPGARVHGELGSLIPVGIRIGRDAQRRLNAQPRELEVTYFDGEKAPCPCIAYGISIANPGSAGQGTLEVSPDKAPAGNLAVAIVQNTTSGAVLRYSVKDEWLPKLREWNTTYDTMRLYDAVMNAQGLFKVEVLKTPVLKKK